MVAEPDPREADRAEFDPIFRGAHDVALTKFREHAPRVVDAARVSFPAKLARDLERLRACEAKGPRAGTVDFEAYREDAYLIRHAFPYRTQPPKHEAEILRYRLAHVFIGRNVMIHHLLPRLADLNEQLAEDIARIPAPVPAEALDGLQPVFEKLDGAWIHAANLLDVWEAYEEHLSAACRLLDPSYPHPARRSYWSDTQHYEFTAAAETVLLSRKAGRHAPVPLIRAAIEVGTLRLVLNPMKGSKFQDKEIVPTRGLSADSVAAACRDLKLPVAYGAESLSRIYEWGSLVMHFGERRPHDEMWYVLLYAEAIRRGFLACSEAEGVGHFDALIAELAKRGKLRIENGESERAQSPPPSASEKGSL